MVTLEEPAVIEPLIISMSALLLMFYTIKGFLAVKRIPP